MQNDSLCFFVSRVVFGRTRIWRVWSLLARSDGCCAYRAGTPPTVVYRADRAAFGELIVSAHMFADHMPFNYVDCLDTLAVALPEY